MSIKKIIATLSLLILLAGSNVARAEWTIDKTEDETEDTFGYVLRLNVDRDVDKTVVFAEYFNNRIYLQIIEYVDNAVVSSRAIKRSRNASYYFITSQPDFDSIEEITIDPEINNHTEFNMHTHGGNDYIDGGHRAFAGTGDDVVRNSRSIDADTGYNKLYAGPETEFIRGGYLDDYINARKSLVPVTIYGEPGDDTIIGSEQADTIYAGQGSDKVIGRGGDDTIYADIWRLLPREAYPSDGNDLITGGKGNDTISGYGGDDILAGNRDEDNLYGGRGYDILSGGGGDDLLRSGESGDANVGERLIGGGGADTFETPELYLDSHYNDFDEDENDAHVWLFS